MNSNKCGSNCNGKDKETNVRKKSTNIGPRVAEGEENIVQERKSCGCVRTTSIETKPTSLNNKPRRNSIITQCSTIRNQTKATISATDNKTKVVSRPPLAVLKGTVQTTSTIKKSSGAVKKVTDPKPASNLKSKGTFPSLPVTTVKRNPTRTSTGVLSSTTSTSKIPITKTRSTGALPSAQIKSKPPVPKTQFTSTRRTLPSSTITSSAATSLVASAKSGKCCCTQKTAAIKLPPIQKSLKPVAEQKPLNIPPKEALEVTVNVNRGFDCGSPILDASFHTPTADDSTWLTLKTNITERSSHLPFKEAKKSENFEIDNSGFSLDSAAVQIIFDGIPSLRKKTLKRHLSVSSGYRGIVNLDPYTNKVPPAVLYSDYMIDVIKNIIKKEESLKLSKDFMKQTKILPIYRTAIINWLIKLQQFVNSDANVFFLCIRLFDKLLTRTEIPPELLQLTGMITYWIAHKYADIDSVVDFLGIRKLQELAHSRYTIKTILNYERKMLNILKYDVSVEDPIIFVRYYIYILQIEDSNDVSFCANYLLDCLATSWDINTFSLSLQASGAVFLSLQFLGHNINIWDNIEYYPGYYTIDDMYFVIERIMERLLLIQNESYEFREVYNKYACEKYNYMSLKVCDGIKSLKKIF